MEKWSADTIEDALFVGIQGGVFEDILADLPEPLGEKFKECYTGLLKLSIQSLNFSGNFQGLINWWGCPDILVGANKNNRIGNKIWARWLTFDINLLHSAAQGANLDTIIAHTVRLVWPKNMSNAEAVTHLNLTEFPVYDARNEENWILIKEWKFTTHNTEPANPQDYAGSTTMKRIKFAWAMNRKLEYSSNTDVTPEKNFLFSL